MAFTIRSTTYLFRNGFAGGLHVRPRCSSLDPVRLRHATDILQVLVTTIRAATSSTVFRWRKAPVSTDHLTGFRASISDLCRAWRVPQPDRCRGQNWGAGRHYSILGNSFDDCY